MHIQKLIDYHNVQAEFFESFGVKNEVAVFHRKALALLMDGVAENKRLRQELKIFVSITGLRTKQGGNYGAQAEFFEGGNSRLY